MSDNKRYYYLKLKDNFFDSDELIVLESMQDGHLYSNILLKLYLRSLKNDGRLMFNERIPYSPTALSQVTRHNVGVVEKALSLFSELGLIEVMDNGAIYMTDIQNFIGESSTEADRKRAYRAKIENEKNIKKIEIGQMSYKCPDKSPPEIEIEKDIDIDIKKDNRAKSKRFVPPTPEEVENYCKERNNGVDPVKFFNFYESKDWMVGKNKMKKWKAAIITWEKGEESNVNNFNGGGVKQDSRKLEEWEVKQAERASKITDDDMREIESADF